jgi:hypothetical protein
MTRRTTLPRSALLGLLALAACDATAPPQPPLLAVHGPAAVVSGSPDESLHFPCPLQLSASEGGGGRGGPIHWIGGSLQIRGTGRQGREVVLSESWDAGRTAAFWQGSALARGGSVSGSDTLWLPLRGMAEESRGWEVEARFSYLDGQRPDGGRTDPHTVTCVLDPTWDPQWASYLDCGGWDPFEPPATTVLMDILPRMPLAEAVAELERIGARIVHVWHLSIVRAELPPSAVASLAYDARRRQEHDPLEWSVFVGLDRPPTPADTLRLREEGGHGFRLFSSISAISGTLPDAAIPRVRAWDEVTSILPNFRLCGR